MPIVLFSWKWYLRKIVASHRDLALGSAVICQIVVSIVGEDSKSSQIYSRYTRAQVYWYNNTNPNIESDKHLQWYRDFTRKSRENTNQKIKKPYRKISVRQNKFCEQIFGKLEVFLLILIVNKIIFFLSIICVSILKG